MLQLPFARPYIQGPILILFISTLLWFAEPWSFQQLAYHRDHVADLQWWRFVTGNLIHSNTIHFILNIVGAITIWALYGDYYKTRKYIALTLICGLGCTIGIHFFALERTSYVGLSGAIHGLFAWGVVQDLKRKRFTGWILLMGLVGKIVQEQVQGGDDGIAALIETQVASESHLFGAITGAIIGIWDTFRYRLPDEENSINDKLASSSPKT